MSNIISVKEAHQHFNWFDDEMMRVMDKTIYTGELVETRREIIRNTITLYNQKDIDSYYGYKNIKFVGDLSKISSIILSVNDSRIDKLYPNVNDEHNSFQSFNEHIIPAIKEGYKINVYYVEENKTDLEITYDVYAITDNKRDVDHDFVIIHNHFGGEEKTKNRIILPFYNPTKRLVIFSQYPLTNLKLKLTKENESDMWVDVKFNDMGNNKYICEFEETINFTKIDNGVLYFESEAETLVHVFQEKLMVVKVNASKNLFDCLFYNTTFSFRDYYPELYQQFKEKLCIN